MQRATRSPGSSWRPFVATVACVVATLLTVLQPSSTSVAATALSAGGGGGGGAVFDEKLAFTALHFAYAACCPVANLTAWQCEWCLHDEPFTFDQMLLDAETGLYGYMGHTPDTIYVAFRGTDGYRNWIVDLTAFEVTDHPDIPNAKVHAGFLKAFLRVRDTFRATIARVLASCTGCRSLVTTGHSLGGALSGFAAVDAALYLRNISRLDVQVNMRNFGMPRIGNDVFAAAFSQLLCESCSWRMVHERDIVPHLPPRELGFHAVRNEIWNRDRMPLAVTAPTAGAPRALATSGGETYIVCDDSGEDPQCSDGAGPLYGAEMHLYYMGMYNNNCGQ